MESGQIVAPPASEIVMVEPELVRQMRVLHEAGWGAKSIAREVGVARNTVRRYLRSRHAEVQVRSARWALDAGARSQAKDLFAGAAGGNAVVVQQMLGVAALTCLASEDHAIR